MTYTVKLGPNTVLYNANGNKLKLRDSSFKNVFNNSMAMIKVNEAPVQANNVVSNEPKVEAPKTLAPSINSKRVIKDASGLVGQVVTMSINGRKPVKIKPAVAQAVARVGQSALAVPSVNVASPVINGGIEEKPVQNMSTLSSASKKEVVEPFKNHDGDFTHVEENDVMKESKTVSNASLENGAAFEDLPEEPTISIPIEEIKRASTESTNNSSSQIEKMDEVVEETQKSMVNAVNLDDVREMQEKLDEVGKATLEAKQKVVETQNQINDVIQDTEDEKKKLEKLNKDQEAAVQKSEMLKQKTCEFLRQQMEVLEGKKATYFEQLSDYEVTLQQAREEKKQVEMEKGKKEIECKKAQEDYEAWSELHKAITNRAAEFDSQLGQDDASKVVSFRDLVSKNTPNLEDTMQLELSEPVAVKKMA